MKKYMFTFALSFLCLVTLHAQFSKGTILLDGYISYSNDKSKSDQGPSSSLRSTSSSLSFRPSIGLFLKPDLVIGVGPGVALSRYTSKYDDGNNNSTTSHQKNTGYSFTVYVTKYYKLFDKLYATASLQAGASTSKTTDDNSLTNKYSGSAYNVSLHGGLTYLLSNRFAISTSVASIGYSHTKGTHNTDAGKTTNTSSGFGTSFDLNSFNFSIQYFFRNKTE